jgi:ABC-type Na+ efflux pump permease subunit
MSRSLRNASLIAIPFALLCSYLASQIWDGMSVGSPSNIVATLFATGFVLLVSYPFWAGEKF